MRDSGREENWGGGTAYENYMGRWSRLAARDFLKWLALPADHRWLDVGCGTGALTQTILTQADPRTVQGIDPSEDFIAYARNQIRDPRVHFQAGHASHLPGDSARFEVTVSGLALNFMPDLEAALAEMIRVTTLGGTVAVYVWDYAGEMQWLRYFWDAAVSFDSAAIVHDEGRRFPICQSQPLQKLFADSGLADVRVAPIDIPTRFRNFDDYWTPFQSGGFPAPQYLLSLNEASRDRLREHVRDRVTFAADGSIHLIARVWAARGIVRT